MAFGTIELTLRPLKLAFLVDPRDRNALVEAIKVNTFLWGGMFNLIVPVFSRLPVVWRERSHGKLSAASLITGYLDAFDPDYVAKVGNITELKTGVGHRELIDCKEILLEVNEDWTPKYGVGLVEILQHFAQEELTFVRHRPIQMHLPEIGSDYPLFFAATFGALTAELEQLLRRDAAQLPGLEWKPCSIDTFAEFLKIDNYFLRRLSGLHLRPNSSNKFSVRNCLFFLDAAQAIDVIDYWNLRASGWNVFPVPKQGVASEILKKRACEFITQYCYRLRRNPQWVERPTLMKSRCTSETEMESFWKELEARRPTQPEPFEISFQSWVPRIWDEVAREQNDATCWSQESNTTSQDFDDAQGFKRFQPLGPVFASRWGGRDKPRFANEIELRLYGGEEPFAEAIPEAEQELVRVFSPIMDRDDFRLSKRGPIHLAKSAERAAHFSVPKAEDFFKLWLSKRGWKADLSDKGHVAKQMLRQLGGIWGTQTLANEQIVALLFKLEGGTAMAAAAFRAELKRACANQPFLDPDTVAKRLVEIQAVQLGLELQCPSCRQHSWFSITEADYDLRCPKCLQTFNLPSHEPNKMAWAYRSIGPFSLPRRAYGVYSVLLTLRFFARVLDTATTPMLSFTAKNGTDEIEADLGLFYQESRQRLSKVELVFVECKTNIEFTRRDAERMGLLAKHFPGAVLVFATLNKSFSKREQTLLRPVVNRGRRRWKEHRPYNPVLLLTGIELFGKWPPYQTWKDAGGVHARFSHYPAWMRGELLSLCDATQQIYLGLPSWEQRLSARRRNDKPKQPAPGSPGSFPSTEPGQNPDTGVAPSAPGI